MKRTRSAFIVLALVSGVLTAAGCGSSGNGLTAPRLPGGSDADQVTISSLAYSALTVARGTTVTWKNDDGMTHTATADNADSFLFDTGDIAAGSTSGGITFTQAGVFPYHCKLHSSMHGTITVQ